jgi:hypothetical protein
VSEESTSPTLPGNLRELLAAIEHKRWSTWQIYMHGMCLPGDDGSLTIPPAKVRRWDRLATTPYADLSEDEKNSDREQVDRYWPIRSPDHQIVGPILIETVPEALPAVYAAAVARLTAAWPAADPVYVEQLVHVVLGYGQGPPCCESRDDCDGPECQCPCHHWSGNGH